MKDSSAIAYEQLKIFGTLSAQQSEVFNELLKQPASGRMLAKRLGFEAWKRCSELKRMGLIESEEEKRPCEATGKLVYYWRIAPTSRVDVIGETEV